MPSLLHMISFLYVFVYSALSYDVPPTVTNSSGEYYIASFQNDFSDGSITCTHDTCYVTCNDYLACDHTSIDASRSTELTIDCNYRNGCQNTKLTYGPSDILLITCEGEDACKYAEFNANYTHSTHIQCSSAGWSDSACFGSTFKASHADSVVVSCYDHNGCSSMNLYANYAKTVSIEAFGDNALYLSTIHASHAGQLALQCKSFNQYSYGCQNNNLYVPSAFNLACYGQSCEQLGDLYVTNSSITQGTHVYFNGCGECESAGDCAPHMTIHCSDNHITYGDIMKGDWCGSDYCGCQQLVNTFGDAYFVNNSVSSCPNHNSIAAVRLVLGALLAIIFGSLCCCICICVGVYYACCRPRVSRNAALLAGATYVAANQQPAPVVQPQVVVMNPNQMQQQQVMQQPQVVYVPPQQQAVQQQVVVASTAPVVNAPAPAVTGGSVNAYPTL
eukprot:101443_1